MSQAITPPLRQWIVDQAQAGVGPEAVLNALLEAGWHEEVALLAMESTLHAHLGLAPSPPAPVRGPVPEPALDHAPTVLDLGDRQVPVLCSLARPRVVVLRGLLSDEECDALVDTARPRMARSRTVSRATGDEEVHPDRTSQGMFFQRGETDLCARIEARLARLTRWPVERGEGIQVLNYAVGAEYKPHYDYFDPAEPGTPTLLQRGGQRVATVVMYLNTPNKGGATVFPDVGLEVAAQKGNAVFFSYERPDPATRTLHGGACVRAGEKWVATKWLRQGAFK